ncbi:MAG TPA: hypothetical protein PKD72_12570, partial [Gemmatales bacterium]|nr:hypothetical protein [Gemmatales bacterium]
NLKPAVQKLLEQGATVISPDVFLTGEWHGSEPSRLPMVPQKYHKQLPFLGYWLGYNRSLAGQRVHDLLLVIAHLKARKDVKEVWLVAGEGAEPWSALAAIVAASELSKVAMSSAWKDFDFRQV